MCSTVGKPSSVGNNRSRKYVYSNTAATTEILATAGAPGTSTAIRRTTAADTPATAETMTTAETRCKLTAGITSATATAEAAGLL
jgi:hypothetical protein